MCLLWYADVIIQEINVIQAAGTAISDSYVDVNALMLHTYRYTGKAFYLKDDTTSVA